MTHRQKSFVSEYIQSGNATQSAIKAGYSEKTAKEIGSRLLTNEEVQQAISDHQQRASDKADVSLEWWIKKVKAIAETAKSDATKVKALDLIGKHLGAYVNELSVIQKLPDNELDNIVNKLMAKM